MNSDTAISVSHVSKKYLIGVQKDGSLRGSLAGLIGSKTTKPQEEFWALNDVSFEIKKGEVIGIIGKNGAGKSTLLKILSQITKPNTGRIEISGRVASLLEVGTGFHPELTGRENIFLNGTILGMTRQEVKDKFDEIVEFSGVQKFIDTPVKHYSSGMYVRLAFAVAAHLDPEILIIDEVLAVGDAEFQKKCLGKMKEVSVNGRTVIFVSHNMAAVRSLCDKGILIEKGVVKQIGKTDMVISNYMSNNSISKTIDNLEISKDFILKRINVLNKSDQSKAITTEDQISIDVFYQSLFSKKDKYSITLRLKDQTGNFLFSSGSIYLPNNSNNSILKCIIPSNLLNTGEYWIDVLLIEERRRILGAVSDIATFNVIDSANQSEDWLGRSVGYFKPKLDWHVFEEKL